MRKRGYDVSELAGVFEALDRTADEQQQSALPDWLSTHPAPAERVKTMQARAEAVGSAPNAKVGRDAYLRSIDNLVYGRNPRDGFFRNGTFYHPALRFKLTFPRGWQAENMTQAVVGVAPQNQAALQLTIAGDTAPETALRQFFAQPGLASGRALRDTINGDRATIAEFQASTEQGVVQGIVAFIAHGGGTYQLVGYTPAALYAGYAPAMEQAIRSFGPVTDPAILNVQPQRIDVVQLRDTITVDELARRYDSPVPPSTLAVLNQVRGPGAQLPAGMLVKRVTGPDLGVSAP
jgi:predicted Zn-dependent protease